MQIRVGDASFRLKNVPFMTNFMLKFAVLRPFLAYDILVVVVVVVVPSISYQSCRNPGKSWVQHGSQIGLEPSF